MGRGSLSASSRGALIWIKRPGNSSRRMCAVSARMIPVIGLQADVGRSGLLFEIEVDAVVSAPGTRPRPVVRDLEQFKKFHRPKI
jgi:hypothetical protein